MVPLSPQPPSLALASRNFTKRTLSAAIGGPLAVGAIMLGYPYVDILAALLLGILLWEWSQITGLPFSHPINSLAAIMLGWLIFGTGYWPFPVFLIGLGIFLITFYHYKIGARFLPSLLLLSGPIYIWAGMASILFLAKATPLTLLWALLIVWATDTGAYVAGSLIGGPKLIPRISPGKTWAGLIGGSMIGSALGVTASPYCQIPVNSQMALSLLTILITLFAHSGDILESAAKRVFKAKDSGFLIPGHGGFLDRMDSLLLVALFLISLHFFKVI